MKRSISLLALGFATACSGGGGGADKIYEPLDGTGTSSLATTVSGATVSLDRDASTLTFNGDEGQISADGETVTFESGATMSLTGTDNEYSRLFVLSGDEPGFGAFGESTAGRDIPNGSASFDGSSILVVSAPEGVFDLTGDVTAEVEFGEEASVTFENLSGTRSDGLSAPSSIDDFGTVEVIGIDVSDSSLSGGATSITTDETSVFDDVINGGVNGILFGPNAEEVGGSIEATGNGGALTGGFVASQ